MQLEQSFEIARPIEPLWAAFGDLKSTASCIPGAEISKVEGNKAEGVFRVQLGPIKAAFAGEAEVTRDDATHSGTITGAGRDGKNSTRVKATVGYKLVELSNSATRIDLSVDYSITGPLAQFRRAGIVKDMAASITKLFAKNLEAMLAQSADAGVAEAPSHASDLETSSAPAPSVSASVSAPPTDAHASAKAEAPAQSINLVSLLLGVLWQRITGIFRSSKT